MKRLGLKVAVLHYDGLKKGEKMHPIVSNSAMPLSFGLECFFVLETQIGYFASKFLLKRLYIFTTKGQKRQTQNFNFTCIEC